MFSECLSQNFFRMENFRKDCMFVTPSEIYILNRLPGQFQG